MIAAIVIVLDKGIDLGFQVAWKIVVFQQDSVFERLMPVFDLSLGLRMAGCAANMRDFMFAKPVCEIARDVGRAIV